VDRRLSSFFENNNKRTTTAIDESIIIIIITIMMQALSSSSTTTSSPWEARLKAISDILPTSASEEELLEVNAVLNEMRIVLQRQKKIDQPPRKKKPPPNDMFPDILLTSSSSTATPPPSRSSSLIPSQAVVSSSFASHNYNNNRNNNKNPFATFRRYMDDDSSSSSEDEDDDNDTDENEDETGSEEDRSTITHSPQANVPFPLRAPPAMDVRRLLIRLYDAQSSIHAALAVHCRKRYAWLDGAEHFQRCIMSIQAGLVLADTAITKFLVTRRDPVRLQLLTDDANIIEVAVQSMARHRDQYVKIAQQQANYLVRKLTPQWKSRDDVKERMGDRWYQNPNPRRDYAKQRAALEEQLRIVNAALAALQVMDVTKMAHDTQGLLQKLSTSNNSNNNSNNNNNNNSSNAHPNGGDAADRRRRYNGQRPLDTTKRVSWDDYPDATEFGWTFTGSHDNVVEFFERDDMKLDWYFTTATVKTSLDHPKQGRTQLFANKVSPEMYLQILLEPRAHTGQRYHTTKNKK
jgi:hypothetical protein